ncbi:MAG: hybrid sensor histidine kinase/response regulator [Ktedonobacterales bacterium]|nr:hybrid sensor histidine kinase/response regulator [Ktedonobacterales bacterium]
MSVPRILIVDDDDALLRALPEALRLRMKNPRIDTTDSAATALERIATVDYDAVVSDIKMPGMDGLTLLTKIRELRPDTPTLLITGHGEHDLAIQALRGGAYDFIQKPIDRDYFIASLGRAIQVRQLRRQVEAQRLTLERHADRLESTVRERTRELVEANHAKELFLSIASHELRTPLTSLKGLAQFTRRRLDRAGAPEALYLARMERAIERMEALVSDLLDVSRIESGKLSLRLERSDLLEIVRQVVEDQRMASERKITLRLLEAPAWMEADADRLGQVLANLLANALKYSADTAPVAVSVSQEGEEAVVCVRDHGCGIPPDQLAHIFERFYRVPDAETGSGSSVGLGLGLYISREIIERHRGRIWAESTPGMGSAFYVSLPLLAEITQPNHTHDASGAAQV